MNLHQSFGSRSTLWLMGLGMLVVLLWPRMATAHATSPHSTLPSLANPACASWGPDRVDCFVVGNDGRLYHTWSDLASSGDARDFAPWRAEPAPPPDGFDPAAGLGVTAWGVGRLDIMAITREGDVVHTYYDQNAWQLPDWEFVAFPGNVGVSEIGCSSWGVNRIDCFARGADRHIYQIVWDGSSWGVIDLGALPTGTSVDGGALGVGAAAYSSTALFQVVVAVDGNMYTRKWDGTSWSAWANGDKPTGDALMTVSCQAGVIYLMDCLFGDVMGRVWHRSYYDGGNAWLDWHNLDAVGGGTIAYYASGLGTSKIIDDQGALYALTYGEDGRLYLGFGRGGASSFEWYGWQDLGRPPDQHTFLPLVSRE